MGITARNVKYEEEAKKIREYFDEPVAPDDYDYFLFLVDDETQTGHIVPVWQDMTSAGYLHDLLVWAYTVGLRDGHVGQLPGSLNFF
jgi:hypothetical protein